LDPTTDTAAARTGGRNGIPTEAEVRVLVTRIATSVLAETARAAAGPGSEPEARGPEGPGLGGSDPQRCVAIGADHGGFVLKERLAAWLREHGWTVRDSGTRSADAVDYPDYALAVGRGAARRTRRQDHGDRTALLQGGPLMALDTTELIDRVTRRILAALDAGALAGPGRHPDSFRPTVDRATAPGVRGVA
jgi:hypothetical protein